LTYPYEEYEPFTVEIHAETTYGNGDSEYFYTIEFRLEINCNLTFVTMNETKINDKDTPTEVLIPPWYPDIIDPSTLMFSSNQTNCPLNEVMTLKSVDMTSPYSESP
jgi:hypothetical protein